MKKIFFAIIMAAIVSNIALAQKPGIAIDTNENQQILAFQKVALPGINKNTDAAKNVNATAAKDFSKFCKNATEVYWEVVADGTVASYKIANKKARRFYNAKGHLLCDILYCQEADLTADVIQLVKNSYGLEYTITSAEEIKTTAKKYYFIYIENKTSFKKLRVYDGEIEVVQECFN
jgi:hypothetical protein